MAYVSIDIQFVALCLILISFGILIGLYYDYSTHKEDNMSKNKPLQMPKRLEQIYWETHCGICCNSYEDTYLANKGSLSIVVLTPCYHTCCPSCFDKWAQQSQLLKKELRCFFCNCAVIFPLQHRMDCTLRQK